MDRLVLKNNDNLRIPQKYQAVEWLENSNVASGCIELRVTPSYRIGIKAIIDKPMAAGELVYNSVSGSSRWGVGADTNTVVGQYGNTYHQFSTSWLDTNNEVEFNYLGSGNIKNNGTILLATIPSQSSFSSRFLVVGGNNGNGVLTPIETTHRIREIYISDGDSDICHLIPCRRLSDNNIGFYDIIGNEFLPSIGTGFITGVDIPYYIRDSFSPLITKSLQSMLISNCPLIDGLSVLGSIYSQLTAQGTPNNQLNHFYLQWTSVQQKDNTVLMMLRSIAQNKAADGTTRVFHGMKLADGTNDDTIAPIIDGDLQITTGIYQSALDALGVIASETEDYGEGLKRAFAHHFRDLRVIYDPNKAWIEFADPEVLRIALANWDTDHDGGIGTGEAAAVTGYIGTKFTGNTLIETFNEFQYFVNATLVNPTINNGAFKGCTNLREITLPDGITQIGVSVFSGCSSLQHIDLPTSITLIKQYAFESCAFEEIDIPEGVTTLEAMAFASCTALRTITIPSTMRDMSANYIFNNVTGITTINIASIEDWCRINFGASVNTQNKAPHYINPNAAKLVNGQPVTVLVVPNDVTAIQPVAFYSFKQLESVTLHDLVTRIGAYAFYGCTALEEVNSGRGLTSIGDYAFYHAGNSNYKFNLELPALVSLGTYAFYEDDGLEEILNLGTITAIEAWTFYHCLGLKKAVLPPTLTSIAASAFRSCNALKEIECKSIVPPTLASNLVFSNVPSGGVLTVPAGAYYNYQNLDSNWGNVRNWALSEKYSEEVDYAYAYYNITSEQVGTDVTVIYSTSAAHAYYLDNNNTWQLINGTTYRFPSAGLHVLRVQLLIPQSWFQGVASLKRVVLPPKSQNRSAGSEFRNCSNLTDMVLPPVTYTFSNSAFAGSGLVNLYIFDLSAYLNSSFTTSNGSPFATSIDHHLFLNGKEITELVIPNDVTSIPAYAFNYCKSIVGNLIIPASLTNIGRNALSDMGITNLIANGDFAIESIWNGTGNGTGDLIIHGNVIMYGTGSSAHFKRIIIDGNFPKNAFSFVAAEIEEVRIGGDFTNNASKASQGPIVSVADTNFRFLEIMGSIEATQTINYSTNSFAEGFVIHLGYDAYVNNAVPCTPSIIGASSSRTSKVYVGKGNSAAEDNNILSVYLLDAGWSQYASKLDTWYNFLQANPNWE